MRLTIPEQVALKRIKQADPEDYAKDPGAAEDLARVLVNWPTLPIDRKLELTWLMFVTALQHGENVITAVRVAALFWTLPEKIA